jgi:hypothetical protein
MHIKRLTQWNPKAIPSDVKQDLSGQPMYPAYHCLILGPSLLQLVILGPHKNQAIPSLVHKYSSGLSTFSIFYLKV